MDSKQGPLVQFSKYHFPNAALQADDSGRNRVYSLALKAGQMLRAFVDYFVVYELVEIVWLSIENVGFFSLYTERIFYKMKIIIFSN